MLLTNYHTHCDFCDGAGNPEDYILSALDKNFDVLGFTSHAPMKGEEDWTVLEKELPEYLKTIDFLKEKYKGKIEVYKGLEIDYIEGLSGPSSAKFTDLNLDYCIGSVHMIPTGVHGKFLAIDGEIEHLNQLLEDIFNGDFEKLSERYYGLVRDMVKIGGFQILGHLDLIKKRNSGNRYFDESKQWYKTQVRETLDVLAETGIILEVNTGGIARKAIDSIYPSPWILKEAAEKNIPIMLNADAHTCEDIDFYFEEARDIIKECGYKELHSLTGGKWITSKI